ncbi:MAG: hypothetical protein GF400_07260 [Candidatus Eisenbacteria bacterium]|nr:hypothetical protein [Candidatus Eisenbacteria bacterium]
MPRLPRSRKLRVRSVGKESEMRATSILALVASALALCAVGASAECEGDVPASVLECYEKAYSGRDLESLSGLYADDYLWVAIVPQGAEVLDREQVMESARNMFQHPEVRSVTLSFSGESSVIENEADGTWRIEGVVATLETLYGEVSEAQVARTCATLYVRQNGEGFELFREVTLGNDDCEAWTALGSTN